VTDLEPHEPTAVDPQVCPKCGKPSASPPAEVYCVDCATEGWEKDAAAHRAAATRPTAVDPRSGEVIDLANTPHADLVEAFLILQDHERRAKEWRTAVEDELVRRAGTTQTDFVGEWQLDIDRGYQRKWDVDETESTVIRLIADHALSVADISGIIKTTRSVDGNIAKRLLEAVHAPRRPRHRGPVHRRSAPGGQPDMVQAYARGM
jgi:hypothetical protein